MDLEEPFLTSVQGARGMMTLPALPSSLEKGLEGAPAGEAAQNPGDLMDSLF